MGSFDDQDDLGTEVATTPNVALLDALARRAVDRSRLWLLSRQHVDGYWSGAVEGEPALEADYVLFQAWLGRCNSDEAIRCGARLLEQQRAHGGWSIDPAGPPHLSATVKAYFALKLLGHTANSESLARARDAINRSGGVLEVNSVTRYWLALLGQLRYSDCDPLPVELFFGPKWLPTQVSHWGARARQVLVPLSIVWAHRPVRAVPAELGIAELFACVPNNVVARPPVDSASEGRRLPRSWWATTCDRGIKLAENLRLCWLRGLALRRATEWILERFVASDGLGANFQSLVWSWIALHCQGFSDTSPEWRFCQEQLDALLSHHASTCQVRPTTAPVWDTAFALQALAAADVSSDERQVQASIRWLLEKEVTRRGDWGERSSADPSGWYREHYNEFYPDVECTAATLTALGHQFGRACVESGSSPLMTFTSDGDGIELSPSLAQELDFAASPTSTPLVVLMYGRFSGLADARQYSARLRPLSASFERGRRWLLAMQNIDGGWGRYDRCADSSWLSASPFADALAVSDRSESQVTGQVLQFLGSYDHTPGDSVVARALVFLEQNQRRDGSWVGLSGSGPVAATAQVLAGLKAIGLPKSAPSVRAAIEWLVSRQQSCGGWGDESSSVGEADELTSRQAMVTPTHTAWCILGLLGFLGRHHPALRRAITWIVDQQRLDGSWEEIPFANPGDLRAGATRHELFPNYFSLLALGNWAKSP